MVDVGPPGCCCLGRQASDPTSFTPGHAQSQIPDTGNIISILRDSKSNIQHYEDISRFVYYCHAPDQDSCSSLQD